MTHTLRIADIVHYDGPFGREGDGSRRRWRITSFLQLVWDDYDGRKQIDHPGEQLSNSIVGKILLEEKLKREAAGRDHGRRFHYRWCLPEEATHVEMTNAGATIAPIDECEFVEEVAWSRELIDRERNGYKTFFLLGQFTDWEWSDAPV